MAKEEWIQCTNGCTNRRGQPMRHKSEENCPRFRKSRKEPKEARKDDPTSDQSTVPPHEQQESVPSAGDGTVPVASPTSSSSQAPARPICPPSSNLSQTPTQEMSHPPSNLPSISAPALARAMSPPLSNSSPIPASAPAMSPSEFRANKDNASSDPFCMRESQSSEIPTPGHQNSVVFSNSRSLLPSPERGSGIPETPQRTTPTPAPARRVLGSPLKPMHGLNDTLLDRTMGQMPSPLSTTRSVSTGGLSRSPSEPINSDEDEKHPKAKRPKMTEETAEYQKDKTLRDTYYRNTSGRLKERLKILGIYTNCIGILYLHR